MNEPIEVELDRINGLAYIRYHRAEVAGTLDVWRDGSVAADIDDAGRVLGIEVLGLDDETLGEARRFAESRGLVFPTV